jgi:hypothetical protein
MSTTSGHGTTSKVLVVYGAPPGMRLFDPSGRSLGKTFELTRFNQPSFEIALRRALAPFLGDHVSLANARMVLIHDASELMAAVRTYGPHRVIYYGHAIADTKVLLPSLGKSITTWQLTNVLKGSSVADFDILGCSSVSIAAELAVNMSATRIGYLRNARQDNIVADPITLRVKALTIDPQPLYHFEPRSR